MKRVKIVAVIPARGGSKGVFRKNIKLLNGEPLISYAIDAALKSQYIDKVVVSTEDAEIAEVARKYKAETPFIRPKSLAGDKSSTLSVLVHAVKKIEQILEYKLDIVVLIQPTSPFVTAADIDKSVIKLIKSKANSCVSVCEVKERPEWMFLLDTKNSYIKRPFFLGKLSKKPTRQLFPTIFRLNGAVYVVRRDVLMKKKAIIDYQKSTTVIMPIERSVDIDHPIDFYFAEAVIKYANNKSLSKHTKYD